MSSNARAKEIARYLTSIYSITLLLRFHVHGLMTPLVFHATHQATSGNARARIARSLAYISANTFSDSPDEYGLRRYTV
uniref:Uncharacterized protein n=1 Tax=Pararge aegeria TaxID=116150 RepID=S4NWI7_9NEOP